VSLGGSDYINTTHNIQTPATFCLIDNNPGVDPVYRVSVVAEDNSGSDGFTLVSGAITFQGGKR
jgi:hypothetical protein